MSRLRMIMECMIQKQEEDNNDDEVMVHANRLKFVEFDHRTVNGTTSSSISCTNGSGSGWSALLQAATSQLSRWTEAETTTDTIENGIDRTNKTSQKRRRRRRRNVSNSSAVAGGIDMISHKTRIVPSHPRNHQHHCERLRSHSVDSVSEEMMEYDNNNDDSALMSPISVPSNTASMIQQLYDEENDILQIAQRIVCEKLNLAAKGQAEGNPLATAAAAAAAAPSPTLDVNDSMSSHLDKEPSAAQQQTTTTTSIVTNAIEILLRDVSHTKCTFLKHEQELSTSNLPGVIPITKQLFSSTPVDIAENDSHNTAKNLSITAPSTTTTTTPTTNNATNTSPTLSAMTTTGMISEDGMSTTSISEDGGGIILALPSPLIMTTTPSTSLSSEEMMAGASLPKTPLFVPDSFSSSLSKKTYLSRRTQTSKDNSRESSFLLTVHEELP